MSHSALFADRARAATLMLWLAFLPTLLILYLILNWLPTLVVANGLDRTVAPQASLRVQLRECGQRALRSVGWWIVWARAGR